MQLLKHQLITISDIRFTQKFEKPVKILIKFYKLCTILMLIVAISILPALTIQLDFYNFRQSAYEYFKNPMVLCDDMFIADHRHWKIYVPYFCSLIFGAWCSITGVTSVFTCLLMIYESRNIVSKETLNMQRNFTGILIYQVCIVSATDTLWDFFVRTFFFIIWKKIRILICQGKQILRFSGFTIFSQFF